MVAADTSYVIRVETYRKDVLSGPYIEYYKNGICATNGKYRHGKKVGWWIRRSSEGIRIAKNKYRKGEVVKGISYNPVF